MTIKFRNTFTTAPTVLILVQQFHYIQCNEIQCSEKLVECEKTVNWVDFEVVKQPQILYNSRLA